MDQLKAVVRIVALPSSVLNDVDVVAWMCNSGLIDHDTMWVWLYGGSCISTGETVSRAESLLLINSVRFIQDSY
jgi:hypothetical protein